MSGYYVKRPEDSPNRKGKAYSKMYDAWPAIATFLAGRDASEDGGAECPGSLILFLEGDKLKCCLSPKVGRQVAFTVLDEPLDPFTSLEMQILAGNLDWKQRR